MLKKIKVVFKYIKMYLSMLIPKNKKLVVFGAWLGERFTDNSAKLFIEANKYDELTCVWITKEKSVYDEIKGLGYKVCMWGTPEAKKYQLKAGYAVISNGISDLEHTYLGRAVILDLWHGVPLKKICYDDKYEKNWDSPKQKIRDFFLNIPLGKEYYFATSKTFVEIYKSCFRKKDKYIVCLGQPRNDIFFEKKPEPLYKDKKIILYCPTHRREGAQTMNVDELFELDRLEEYLEKYDYYFVIKKHFYHRNEVSDLSSYNRIIDITNDNVDIQKLIMEVNLLITDYSSIYIDYLLLDKPLMFYCYDYDDYLANDREMYFDYDVVTPGVKAVNFDKLLEELENFGKHGNDYGREERQNIRDFFYCKDGQDRVSDKIIDMIMHNKLK